MTMKVRMVHLTFGNGLTVVGVVPADFSDEELQSQMGVAIDVAFSDAAEVPRAAPVGKVLARIAAAAALEPVH